jgi:hypothetical protein
LTQCLPAGLPRSYLRFNPAHHRRSPPTVNSPRCFIISSPMLW